MPNENVPRLNIACENAGQLLERLRPGDPIWRGGDYKRWLFRGQWDSTWDLVPSAFRAHTHFVHRGQEACIKETVKEQLDMEKSLISDFYELVNETGLKVPGDVRDIEDPKDPLLYSAIEDVRWPPEFFIELTAIAQHHGVPTRFLDFTYSALVAAFFSVFVFLQGRSDSIATTAEADGGNFAVWGIDGDFMDKAWPRYSKMSRLRQVVVSGFDNVFLQRQNGLFIYDTEASKNVNDRGYQTINEAIEQAALADISQRKNLELVPAIIKLEAPQKEAKELLRQLEKQRVNRAYLMPTYDNVRKTISDRHFILA